MKKILAFIGILLIVSAFSFRHAPSGIKGTLEPADGAKKISATNGTNTVSVIPAMGGFFLEVKPGTWTLVVEAIAPYKDAVVENIVVTEGQVYDAGWIKLKTQSSLAEKTKH